MGWFILCCLMFALIYTLEVGFKALIQAIERK